MNIRSHDVQNFETNNKQNTFVAEDFTGVFRALSNICDGGFCQNS